MSQTIVYILLFLALALPVVGAVALRLIGERLNLAQLYAAAAALLCIVLASVFLLARGDVPSLQVGSLSVLLPVAAPEDSAAPASIPAPEAIPSARPSAAIPTAGATAAPAATTAIGGTSAPAATSIPVTAAPTEAPTIAPTETLVPTVAPTETPVPTAAPTAPPASRQRTYTVQPGDTLRSIAEQFNVSVTALLEANKLTPQQADSLRVGQELTIP